jgi:hypothetical protein
LKNNKNHVYESYFDQNLFDNYNRKIFINKSVDSLKSLKEKSQTNNFTRKLMQDIQELRQPSKLFIEEKLEETA